MSKSNTTINTKPNRSQIRKLLREKRREFSKMSETEQSHAYELLKERIDTLARELVEITLESELTGSKKDRKSLLNRTMKQFVDLAFKEEVLPPNQPNSEECGLYSRPVPVSVDTPPFEGQRPTMVKEISDRLKEGFNTDLFSPIVCARIDGNLYVLDGLHRKAMYKITFPERDFIPAIILDFDSVEAMHRHFVDVNHYGIKKMGINEIFVNEWKAKVPYAVSLHNKMQQSGLRISMDSPLNTSFKSCLVSGDPNGFEISYHTITKMFDAEKGEGIKAVRQASAFLRQAFKDAGHPVPLKINSEMLYGLAIIFNRMPGHKGFWRIARDKFKNVAIGNSKLSSAAVKSFYNGSVEKNSGGLSWARNVVYECSTTWDKSGERKTWNDDESKALFCDLEQKILNKKK